MLTELCIAEKFARVKPPGAVRDDLSPSPSDFFTVVNGRPEARWLISAFSLKTKASF
jgi:hypothetical protein